MRFLPILAAAGLALSGCTTTQSIDTTIKASLPQACALLETAHAAFVIASSAGSIKDSTIRKESAAYAGVQTICADPAGVTASNALVVVATAYATISLALKDARAAQ